MFEEYKNYGGNSGIRRFRTGEGFIDVVFKDNMLYTYTNQSTGVQNIEKMQHLAKQGFGLNSFISKVIKKGYQKKSYNPNPTSSY